MSESTTPICDLIERLLSPLMSPHCPPGTLGTVIENVRPIESAMMMGSIRFGGSSVDRRERERLKKQRYRARKNALSTGDSPPGTNPDPILTKTQEVIDKVSKKESGVHHVHGDKPEIPKDDWPSDFLDQFWAAFPPFRRQAKAKVGQKLAKIRAAGSVTWQVLFAGVLKFAATNPGEYAPAPMVWLNDGRWDREYGTQKGFSNGKAQSASTDKIGFSGLAARIRYGDLDGESRPAPEDLEPVNRR
jgi:hypothetical protein